MLTPGGQTSVRKIFLKKFLPVMVDSADPIALSVVKAEESD